MRGRIAKLTFACAAAAASLALCAPGAGADPPVPPLPDCANPTTPDQLFIGQDAVGYTVRRGQDVEAFNVKILGVLKDGIDPGRDLIVIDTNGPVIDEGGISEGMSGSPVYTLDGDLIGAVAYSFAYGKSTIGGVTPAPDMIDVLSAPFPASRRAGAGSDPQLDATTRSRIADAEGVSASQVPHEMTPIGAPVSISAGGVLPAHRDLLKRAFAGAGVSAAFMGGGARQSPIFPSAGLQAGDSFGAAFSFGDVSAGALGETTYVCGGQAVAFGHPFLFDGPTRMGATRVDITAIVNDPVGAAFKLGVLTDPVGLVNQDRLAGIGASIGDTIPTFPITQDTTDLDSGDTRQGETDIVDPLEGSQLAGYTPYLLLAHYFQDFDSTVDRVGRGSAKLAFTLTAVDPGTGEPLAISRTNRFTSRSDIAFAAANDLLDAAFTLEGRADPIEPTGIDITVSAERAIREYKIKRVLWAAGNGPLLSVKQLTVRAGKKVRARAILTSSDGGPNQVADFVFRVPKKAHLGAIALVGGSELTNPFSGEDALFCALFGECSGDISSSPQEALDAIEEGPRNDQLVGLVSFDSNRDNRGRPKTVTAHKRRLSKVVKGDDSVRIRVAH